MCASFPHPEVLCAAKPRRTHYSSSPRPRVDSAHGHTAHSVRWPPRGRRIIGGAQSRARPLAVFHRCHAPCPVWPLSKSTHRRDVNNGRPRSRSSDSLACSHTAVRPVLPSAMAPGVRALPSTNRCRWIAFGDRFSPPSGLEGLAPAFAPGSAAREGFDLQKSSGSPPIKRRRRGHQHRARSWADRRPDARNAHRPADPAQRYLRGGG